MGVDIRGMVKNFSKRITEYHDKKRSGYSDFILLHYFRIIRHQCKWKGRQIDILLEYINELEYRGLKYRL